MRIETGPNNTFIMYPSDDEIKAINWLAQSYGNRKFERFIEEYLSSRLLNMRKYQDREVIRNMSEDDKQRILKKDAS